MKEKGLIFVILIALLISACGGALPAVTTAPPTSVVNAPISTAVANPPANNGTVELKYMMWGSPEELAVWQKIVDDFQVANPNIKVKVDVADWDSYWDKLNTLIAGGTPPDVFAMDAPLYQDWKSRNALLNLQPYLDATSGILDGLYPVTLDAYKTKEGYFGLPRDFQTIVLFYNKDMFDKAGLAYPTTQWTLDDLRATAKKLTLDTNNDGKIDQWGFSTDLWDMELFWSEAVWEFGGEVINADFSKTLLTEDKARQAWKFMSDMMTVDKSMPNPDTSTQFGNDPFDAGVSAMTTIGHWVVPQYAVKSFKWDVAPFPSGPAGHFTSVNSAGFVIAKQSKHPDEAWQFLKFVLSPAGQTRLAQLGFAVPVLKSIAESPTYLQQPNSSINQKVFLDALAYARPKPSFKGYDEWSTAVGDALIPVWNGEKNIDDVLNEIKTAADAVLAKNQ